MQPGSLTRPSTSAPWPAPRPSSTRLAREELQHPAVHFCGVLVRGPVTGGGNPVDVERADGGANLADQEIGGAERGVVPLAPQEPDPAGELGEIAQERAAAAHLAAVEARAADAVGLDVDGLFGDVGRIAEHVHEQVVAADLAEKPPLVPPPPLAPGSANPRPP